MNSGNHQVDGKGQFDNEVECNDDCRNCNVSSCVAWKSQELWKAIDEDTFIHNYIYCMNEIKSISKRAILDLQNVESFDLLKSRIAEIKSLIEKMEG